VAPNESPKDYGTWHVDAAQMLTMPQQAKTGKIDYFGPPPTTAARGLTTTLGKRGRIAKAWVPHKRVLAVAPPPPPPPLPPISSIGVMDVGQGNCNLLIDQNHEPVTYFDTGYPLWFYTASAPADLHAGAVAPSGPIPQNQGGTLEVILSHWDWDHWRLARVWPALQALPWTVPQQPIGPSAQNFLNGLANCQMYGGAAPAPAINPGPNYTLYTCNPGLAPAPAMILNNTGLALGITTRLPVADVNPHFVLLTGDANFDSLPVGAPPPAPPLTGVTAVHHGSNAHGAADNLPAPAVGIVGRIAYSYGVMPNGTHPYGFPNALARAKYLAANWGTGGNETSTAQGPNIIVGPNNRGNVRMGDQTALNPAHYGNTAFALYPNALT
jgi:hypothetical protein